MFDQSHRSQKNSQLINLDETAYEGDEEMMRIISSLTAATVTAKVRQEMNVEDEIFSAIENRDTELMKQKRIIAEKDDLIAEGKKQIAEKDEKIRTLAKIMMIGGLVPNAIMQATGLTKEQIDSMKD